MNPHGILTFAPPFASTRRPISRRRFLRGAGVALALPLLESMRAPFARAADGPVPRRLFGICNNLGLLPESFFPKDSGRDKWSYQELLSFLESPEGQGGDPRRGLAVFQKAQCANCHRVDGQGQTIGPDLTTITRRFQVREILESVLFPSQVISDQYASKTVVTTEGHAVTGIVAPSGGDAVIVLESTGRKTTIPRDDIEEIVPSRKSSMPDNLFNPLTQEEIADLFAYLRKQRHHQDTLERWLRRTDIDWDDLCAIHPALREWDARPDVVEQVVLESKYAGYIGRQAEQVERFQKLENRRIPDHFDFSTIPQLRAEARQKLSRIRPTSIGQASRVSGITPADLAVLLCYLD